MEVKDLIIPALCVLGTIYFMKGCEHDKYCTPRRSYAPPQPTPVCQPVQNVPTYRQEIYEQPQKKVVRRRIIRRTIRTIPTPTYYYEY